MLEFSNQSNWVGALYPDWDYQQQHQLTAVFKASYQFDETGQLSPIEGAPPLVEADEHQGDALTSSLKAVNEIMPFKEGSEFYLYGTAYPEREGLIAMEVGVGILFTDQTKWKKVLRVFGKRNWKKTMVNYIHDDNPQPVEEIPLSYEYAFGGTNQQDDEDAYAANPCGIGYNSDQRNLLTDELPRIESSPGFMTSPMQKPTPAGFGPLPVFWEPRVSDTGEPVEDPTTQGGCPYSKSTKRCVHNVAPYDQRFKKTFKGGEVIHLRALVAGVSHQKAIQIVLPELKPQLYTIINNEAELLSPVCDTVVINTDERTVSMVYRAGIPWRLTDRRKGWVVLKDQEVEELPYDKEGRDAPRMASN